MSEKKRRAKLNTMIEYASEFTGPTPKIKVKKKKLPFMGIMTGHKVDSLGNKIPGTEMGPDTLYSKTITPEEFHSPKIKIKKKKSGGHRKQVSK